MKESTRTALIFVSVGVGILILAGAAVWTGTMSADHVAAYASVMTLILTLGGVIVASTALETWRAQVRGAARLDVAVEIADAVGTLKIEFQNHRAPLIETREYPNGAPPATDAPEGVRRSYYEYVFGNRFNELNKHIFRVHSLRGKALTVLDRDCSESLVALCRAAREIEITWRVYSDLRARAEARGGAPDEELRRYEYQALVPQSGESTDDLSNRFNERFDATMVHLNRYLGLQYS